MLRKAVAHDGSLRRTAESAKGPVWHLVDFGLPENDHVGMRQHSGVFVSAVSGLHRFIPPKAARPSRGTISFDPSNWKKSGLINGLILPPNGLPFSYPVGRQVRAGLVDRPPGAATDSSSAPVRIGHRQREKTMDLIAELRLPQKSSGEDDPLSGPGGPGTACSITGDSGPFAGEQRGHQAEQYPAPDPDGSAYQAEGRKGGMRDRVQHHAHTLSFR